MTPIINKIFHALIKEAKHSSQDGHDVPFLFYISFFFFLSVWSREKKRDECGRKLKERDRERERER